MLIDLFHRWPISMGWYFDKDESGGGGQPDDSAEDASDQSDPSKAGEGAENGKAGKKERLFTQAELDQHIDDRLKRERKKAEEAAEKARKKAEEEALTKNQEWQTLAETRSQEIATLTKERDELAPFKEQAERYRAVLDAQLAKAKERLPKHILPLIDKLDPVEQMQYLTDHAEELGTKPTTYSETPDPKQKKVTKDEEREGQRAVASVISRNF